MYAGMSWAPGFLNSSGSSSDRSLNQWGAQCLAPELCASSWDPLPTWTHPPSSAREMKQSVFFFFSWKRLSKWSFSSLLRTHSKHVAPAWPSCLYWIPVRNAPTIPFSAVKCCAEQIRNVAWRGVGLTGFSNHKTKLGILCRIQPFVFLLSHRT